MTLKSLKHMLRLLYHWVPFRIKILRRNPKWYAIDDRFSYQERHVDFDIQPGDKVLDIGSGAYPFPYATVLLDRFTEVSRHRHEPLKKDNRPFIVADICSLPFPDGSFDYVYCSHILEHVDDPIKACGEIMRVGKRGYVETPAFAKDALFSWAKGMHRWHVVSVAETLCFFEYSPRQAEGIRSSAWANTIMGKWYHPLQEAFDENQDLFNVMFQWKDSFAAIVFHADGSIRTLNLGDADIA